MAEARCPPPVSEERKRTLSARGLADGLVIWRAGEDSVSSPLVGSDDASSPSLLMQPPLFAVFLAVSVSTSLRDSACTGTGVDDDSPAARLLSFVGSDSVRVSAESLLMILFIMVEDLSDR